MTETETMQWSMCAGWCAGLTFSGLLWLIGYLIS